MTRAASIAIAAVVAVVAVAATASPAHARGRHKVCIERSEVVGYQRCARGGSWARVTAWPALSLDAGLVARHFHDSAIATSRVIAGTDYHITGDAEDIHTIAPRLRLDVGFASAFYVGGDLEFGAATSESTVTTKSKIVSATALTGGGPSYLAAHALFGMRVTHDRLMLGVELAAGERDVSAAATNARGIAVTTVDDTTVDLQLRARAGVWISPWFTVGASVGTSLVDHGDMSFAIEIGGHLRAFDD